MSYRRSFDKGALEAPGSGNWVLIGRKKFNAEVAAGTWDVSGCDKFMVDCQINAMPAGFISFGFDGDVASNYQRTQISAQAAVSGGQVADGGFILNSWPGSTVSTFVFDRRTKMGKADMLAQNSGSTQINMNFGYRYSGSTAMNVLQFNSVTAITGVISVYKWVGASIPAEVVSYDLVKEIVLSNQVLNALLPWDGEVDDMCRVVIECGAVNPGWMLCSPNSDVAPANYIDQQIGGAGATASASSITTYAGMPIGYSGDNRQNITDIYLKVGQGGRKGNMVCGAGVTAALHCSTWKNTVSPVTSLLMHSGGVAVSGVVRIYRLARTSLIGTNPNLNTLWHKYVDANTVEVQPGEVEINGAICRVTKAKQVTLSGNLKSGLAEAANTVYYMYAVRTPGSTDLTYMFDTQAPLMDRYGNTVASFEDCSAKRAWHHPILGLNYRWVGQVLNDASSNILAYAKCMPGYWEGAYAATPAAGVTTLPHALGKVEFKPRILFKSALADTSAHDRIEFFFQSIAYGCMFASHDNVGVPVKTTTGVVVNTAANIFVHNGSWKTSGYYKLILTEE